MPRIKLHPPNSPFGKFMLKALGPIGKLKLNADQYLFTPKSRADERRYWDWMAPVWAKESRTVTERVLNDSLMGTVLGHGNFRKNDHVLSIGSGTGLHEAFIAGNVTTEGKVTCVDSAHGMNLQAKKFLTGEKKPVGRIKNMKVIEAYGEELPLRSGTQDKVLFLNMSALTNNKLGKLLAETRRVIKKTKESAVIINCGPEEATAFQALLPTKGFKVIRIVPHQPGFVNQLPKEERPHLTSLLIVAQPV